MIQYIRNHWPKLVILTVLFLTMHLWQLNEIPYDMVTDEVSMGYDAWSLATYGVDRNLDSWPVYLKNYGGGQSAMYAWLCALLIKLTGAVNAAVIRTPAALFGLLTLITGAILTQKVFSPKHPNAWFVFSLLYLICPYFTMSARMGLDCNLMLGMSTAFLCALWHAVETQKTAHFALAGVLGGLMLYTYALSYVVLPAFLALMLLYLIRIRRVRPRHAAVTAAALALLGWPLVAVQLINALGLPKITLGPFTLTRLTEYRGSELSFKYFLRNVYLTLKSVLCYDQVVGNTTSRFWTLYPVTIPFVLIGAIVLLRRACRSIRSRTPDAAAPIALWGACMLALGFMLSSHDGTNVNRLNAIFFVTAVAAVAGLYAFCGWFRGRARRVAAAALTVVYAGWFAGFAGWYLNPASHVVRYGNPFPEAVAYAEEHLSDRVIHMNQPYAYYLLSSLVSPWEFNLPERDDLYQYENYRFEPAFDEPFHPDDVYIVDVTSPYVQPLTDAGFNSIRLGKALVFTAE